MSDGRYYQRRINQKLAFAKQALSADSEAGIEAALWHLSIAYKAWLAEIANDSQHPLNAVDTSSAKVIADACDKYIPAALAECVQLETNPDSWLAQLLIGTEAAYSLINMPPKKQLPGMIAFSAADTASLPTAAKVLGITNQLAQMIERYREAMQEY